MLVFFLYVLRPRVIAFHGFLLYDTLRTSFPSQHLRMIRGNRMLLGKRQQNILHRLRVSIERRMPSLRFLVVARKVFLILEDGDD